MTLRNLSTLLTNAEIAEIEQGGGWRSVTMSDGILSTVNTSRDDIARLIAHIRALPPREKYEYDATLIRVIDGDTLHLNVRLGCDIDMNMAVRLFGIDTPTMSLPAGVSARSAVIDWLGEWTGGYRTYTLHTIKDAREKYGRYLGVLHREGDAESLNDYLLRTGHAVPYSGGKR